MHSDSVIVLCLLFKTVFSPQIPDGINVLFFYIYNSPQLSAGYYHVQASRVSDHFLQATIQAAAI